MVAINVAFAVAVTAFANIANVTNASPLSLTTGVDREEEGGAEEEGSRREEGHQVHGTKEEGQILTRVTPFVLMAQNTIDLSFLYPFLGTYLIRDVNLFRRLSMPFGGLRSSVSFLYCATLSSMAAIAVSI